jgi:hypothetical protein
MGQPRTVDAVVDLALRGARWRSPDMSEMVACGVSRGETGARSMWGRVHVLGPLEVMWADGTRTEAAAMCFPGCGWEYLVGDDAQAELATSDIGTKRWIEEVAGQCAGVPVVVSNGGRGTVLIEVQAEVGSEAISRIALAIADAPSIREFQIRTRLEAGAT